MEQEQKQEQNKTNILDVMNVDKSFKVGSQDIQILKNVSVQIKKGEFVILVGPSGCGKSTLLHILLGLEEPSVGKVLFLGDDMYAGKDEDTRSDFRKNNIGMVFQQSNWIRSLNVVENVAFPLLLLGYEKPRALMRAMEMLRKVEMQDWAHYIPTELSSGQQQRVGLARALVNDPLLIVADEPTGNLDFEAGQKVMKLFYDLNKQMGKTIIMVTHDMDQIIFGSFIVRMLDGKILGIYDEKNKFELMEEVKIRKTGEINMKSQQLSNLVGSTTNKVAEKALKPTEKPDDKTTTQTPTKIIEKPVEKPTEKSTVKETQKEEKPQTKESIKEEIKKEEEKVEVNKVSKLKTIPKVFTNLPKLTKPKKEKNTFTVVENSY